MDYMLHQRASRTRWGMNKMADILQTTFSNKFLERNIDCNFIEICSSKLIQQLGSNDSGNGLVSEYIYAFENVVCKMPAILLKQNGRHLAEDIFKLIISKVHLVILFEILLKLTSEVPIGNDTALVVVIA